MSTYVVAGAGSYAVSSDLSTWVTTAISGSPAIWHIVRGTDRFVILGSYKTIVLIDGASPQAYDDSEQYPFKGCFSNGLFWRVTNKSNLIQKSADGITWTNVSVPCNTATLSIAASGSLIFVTGNIGASCYSPDGGASWIGLNQTDDYALWTAGCNGSRMFSSAGYAWVAKLDVPANASNPFTKVNVPAAVYNRAGRDIAFFGNIGLIGEAGGGAGYLYTLDNGESWSYKVDSHVTALSGCIHDGSRFVLVGNGSITMVPNDCQSMTVAGTVGFAASCLAFAPAAAPTSAVRVYKDGWKTPNKRLASSGSLHTLI